MKIKTVVKVTAPPPGLENKVGALVNNEEGTILFNLYITKNELEKRMGGKRIKFFRAIYDSETQNIKQYLDYIDPLNGKVLGIAQENLDYITALDPATYQASANGVLWGEAQLGEMWWDIQNARFLDYHQEDINYANKLWGKLFPGSLVEVYQWVSSDVPPEAYEGEGQVKNINDFVSIANIGPDNTIETQYYFWVKGITSIGTNSSKTLSADAVASYIAAPGSAGVPYATCSYCGSTFEVVEEPKW